MGRRPASERLPLDDPKIIKTTLIISEGTLNTLKILAKARRMNTNELIVSVMDQYANKYKEQAEKVEAFRAETAQREAELLKGFDL